MSEKQMDVTKIVQCPLCPDERRLVDLQTHIAEHLESISLFVLPTKIDVGNDDNAEKAHWEVSELADFKTGKENLEISTSPGSPKVLRSQRQEWQSWKRIAIAGTCGLALIIAREIQESTSYHLLVLSRSPQPGLTSQGYQCKVIDYNDLASIQQSLLGVDTVISTVTGNAQLRLIEAAVACRVRRFVPAEFEGSAMVRETNDPLDRGRNAARALLQHYHAFISRTSFRCGILYERFAVNGMTSHRLGVNTGYGDEGDYIVNAREMTGLVPVHDAADSLVSICLTSAFDVGRFVVRALDEDVLPDEMTMCGERMTVAELLDVIKISRGRPFKTIAWLTPDVLKYDLTLAQIEGDVKKQKCLLTLIKTAEGHYDFKTPANLNIRFPEIKPVSFKSWFANNWALEK